MAMGAGSIGSQCGMVPLGKRDLLVGGLCGEAHRFGRGGEAILLHAITKLGFLPAGNERVGQTAGRARRAGASEAAG
jgi:hypothetical protein